MAQSIKPDEFSVKRKTKRFADFESTNIVNNSVRNNSNAVDTTIGNTEQFQISFFVTTVIHWNQLEEDIRYAKSVNSFETDIRINR